MTEFLPFPEPDIISELEQGEGPEDRGCGEPSSNAKWTCSLEAGHEGPHSWEPGYPVWVGKQRGHDFEGTYPKCRHCGNYTGYCMQRDCSGAPWDPARVAKVVGFDPSTGEDRTAVQIPTAADIAQEGFGNATARLLEQARARRTDPGTSHKAAAKAEVRGLSVRILQALEQASAGLTIAQVAEQLGMQQSIVSPRFRPLRLQGRIRHTGWVRRNEGTEQDAIIWELGSEPESWLIEARRQRDARRKRQPRTIPDQPYRKPNPTWVGILATIARHFEKQAAEAPSEIARQVDLGLAKDARDISTYLEKL